MTTSTLLRNGLNRLFQEGRTTSVVVLTGSVVDTDYDDAMTWAQSGNTIWSSGLVFPVSNKQGSSEPILLEQGKILMSDKKLYVGSEIPLSGDNIKIGIGSPPIQHSIIPDGVYKYTVGDGLIYQKCFIREITGGSLY